MALGISASLNKDVKSKTSKVWEKTNEMVEADSLTRLFG
jgi:hypothetical protein